MYVGSNYSSYSSSIYGSNVASIYNKTLSSNKSASLLSSLGLLKTNTYNNSGISQVTSLKTGASGLLSSLNALSSGSAFVQRGANPSDPSAMSVDVKNSKYYSNNQDMSVRIEQLASGQKNQGEALDASAKTGLSGNKSFEIEINGKTTRLSVSLSSKDTNKDLQTKIASAINSSGLALKASVDTSSDGKTSTLAIEASGTGNNDANRFSIRDVGGDSLITRTGAATIISDAVDAKYSINGGESKTSNSNTVDLGNGLTATFKSATNKDVNITMGPDKANALSKLQDFVDSYNDLYTTAVKNGDDPKAGKLFSQLVKNSKTYSASLQKLGISFDDDGYMKLDEDKAAEAIDNGSMKTFFTANANKNYGFTSQLSKIAKDVNNNTAKYITQDAFKDPFSNYDNSSSQTLSDFNSNFMKIFASKNTGMIGMMLDYMI